MIFIIKYINYNLFLYNKVIDNLHEHIIERCRTLLGSLLITIFCWYVNSNAGRICNVGGNWANNSSNSYYLGPFAFNINNNPSNNNNNHVGRLVAAYLALRDVINTIYFYVTFRFMLSLSALFMYVFEYCYNLISNYIIDGHR